MQKLYCSVETSQLSSLLVVFFVAEKNNLCCHSRCLSVRPSSVEMPLVLTDLLDPIALKTRLKRVKSADSCLNGAIAGNSNCKLQIYATYDFLQTNLCALF